MANQFVKNEVDKIFKQENENSKNMALASAWVVANYKGINIRIYDARESSSLCDYNVIATAENVTQAKTIIDEIQFNLREHGAKILSLEGVTDGAWMLLDAGDVIVHVFQETARDIFDLDKLWANYPQVDIPQEYYFGHSEEQPQKKEDPTENYF